MNRRTLFKAIFALFAGAASAEGLKPQSKLGLQPPQNYTKEPWYSELYIEAQRFDGWNVVHDKFRIVAHRFPVGTEAKSWWEYTIPPSLAHHADFIEVVGGPVLKNRRAGGTGYRMHDEQWHRTFPLVDDEWLIKNNYRIARNESYTSVTMYENAKW